MGGHRARAGIAGVAAAALLALAACTPAGQDSPTPGATTSTPDLPAAPAGPIQAVALSPEGFPVTFDELPAFFDEAAALPNPGVMWNGAWRNDNAGGTDAGDPPNGAILTVRESNSRGATPLFVFGWRSGDTLHVNVPEDPTNDWTNQAARDAYASMLAQFARDYEPVFMFLGNENDTYYAQDSEGYKAWIEAYDQAYDAIHEASPSTLVGPVFHYESLSGLGVLAGENTPHWEALSLHDLDRVDVVGISLYPFFSYETPDEIPDNYLAPLVDLLPDIPLVITETGWPASKPDGFDAPWQASPGLQVDYAAKLPQIVEGSGADLRAVTWLFLYEAVTGEGGVQGLEGQIFSTLSLRDGSGEKRPVYDVWAGLDWPADS